MMLVRDYAKTIKQNEEEVEVVDVGKGSVIDDALEFQKVTGRPFRESLDWLESNGDILKKALNRYYEYQNEENGEETGGRKEDKAKPRKDEVGMERKQNKEEEKTKEIKGGGGEKRKRGRG